MHYVEHFKLNDVDTRQVACIALNGKPNAATEGAVGVLGIDITSPTHEVYKCVAVNGSLYTWELLASGLSIVTATVTGSGSETFDFPYNELITPSTYTPRIGDLILDSKGYLYQIASLQSNHCVAALCSSLFATYVDGYSKGEIDNTFARKSDLTSGAMTVKNATHSSTSTNAVTAEKSRAVITIGGTPLKFFVGTQAEYDALSDAEKENLFAIISDDNSKAEIEAAIKSVTDSVSSLRNSLSNGSLVVARATQATAATGDVDGNPIATTYAKSVDLTSGATVVAKANNVNATLESSVEITGGTGTAPSLSSNTTYLVVFETSTRNYSGIFLPISIDTCHQCCQMGQCSMLIRTDKQITILYNGETCDFSGTVSFYKIGEII